VARPPVSLANVPLFRGLDREELAVLEDLLHPRTIPRGAGIILEEQPGEVAYILLSGSVKIHMLQRDGSEVILAVLRAGEVVGEMSLVDSLGRSASVETLEETRLLWMDRESFRRCLETMPAMTYNLVELMSRRLRLADTHIESLASLSVSGRVARHLLALAAEYGEPGPDGVVIPIPLTQSDLAGMVGASRARVNQSVGTFRRRGEVSVDRAHRITVRDADALARRLARG
jgi:CRP-like cAMP-binding protein